MAKTCPSCGAPIDATAMTCPYCGAVIQKEKPVQAVAPDAPIIVQQQVIHTKKHNRNRTTTIIITLLTGGLGGDYFYIGETTKGVITLAAVILTGGIALAVTGIIAIVHLIQFISMSDADFDNKYNY